MAEHECRRIEDTPDSLGHSYVVLCECDWKTTPMLHLFDAVSMFGYHMMDVAFERARYWRSTDVDGTVDTVLDPARPTRSRLSLGRLRRREEPATGPQAPARHLHPAIWAKP